VEEILLRAFAVINCGVNWKYPKAPALQTYLEFHSLDARQMDDIPC